MVWWWSQSATKDNGPKLEETAPAVIAEQTPFFDAPTQNSPRELSREEQATLEFNEMLKEFSSEYEAERASRVKARTSATSDAPLLPSDISQDTLYPTEMSCRSAFDYAMFCQSFGGQFVNVYRYGQFRSCSNHWSDFWLCMRTRNWEDNDKKKAIHDHYKEKAIKWKTGPSSEDIWEVRQEPVKDAFQANLDELEAKIAEWKKQNPTVADPWTEQQGSTFMKPVYGATR